MKTLFKNGRIITMENTLADCVLIQDDIIKYVGFEKELKETYDEIVDLSGHTLMPGFIDAHSHIGKFGLIFSVANLEGSKNIEDIKQKLLEYKQQNNLDDNTLIIGFGYDNNFLEEKRQPNKGDLDFVENPVIITHKSGHMGVLNSKALKDNNINNNTQNPEGGVVAKDDNGETTGYLEETAFIPIVMKTAQPDMQTLINCIKKGQEVYASYGITTAQDGSIKKEDFDLFTVYQNMNSLFLDIVAYADITENKFIVDDNQDKVEYNNNFRLGGYKLFLDGSPQGRTAWMRDAYADDENYYGYPIFKDDVVTKYFENAIDENIQIIVHCNGDMACQQMIDCYEKALNGRKSTIRPVMIHAQLLAKDQLEKVKELGIITSFFVAHTKYWADIHIENFGKEKGENISPVQSAINKDIMYTFHQDSPVIMPNMLETVQAAVTRTTINGTKLNKKECVDVYDALKGVTINSAYQYFEENTKGSIKYGKKADLVILSESPLMVNKNEIEKIKVLATYKNGKLIYKA